MNNDKITEWWSRNGVAGTGYEMIDKIKLKKENKLI